MEEDDRYLWKCGLGDLDWTWVAMLVLSALGLWKLGEIVLRVAVR